MGTDSKGPIDWHLRALMAEAGMFQTTELLAPLREQGIVLSREQVYRLVTKAPERLNVEVLAALCRIFGCQPNDLITVVARPAAAKKTGTGRGRDTAIGDLRHVRARLHRPADPGR
jgi:DNA-binding Xre family transcriptional regulator